MGVTQIALVRARALTGCRTRVTVGAMRGFAVAVTLAWATAASAGNGREEFVAGEEAFRAGRCGEAAQHFESGYRREPLPGFLFNEAQARRCQFDRTRDPEEARRAIALFRVFLEAAPPLDPNRVSAATSLNELLHALPPGEAHEPLTLVLPAPAPPTPMALGAKLERVPSKPLAKRTKIAIGVGVGAAIAVCLATALGVGLYASDKNLPTVTPRW